MEYVLIGFGADRVFEAETNYEAVRTAYRLAAALRFHSWLLFDRLGELIYEGDDSKQPSCASVVAAALSHTDKLGHE